MGVRSRVQRDGSADGWVQGGWDKTGTRQIRDRVSMRVWGRGMGRGDGVGTGLGGQGRSRASKGQGKFGGYQAGDGTRGMGR